MYVECLEYSRNTADAVVVARPKGKKPLGRPRYE